MRLLIVHLVWISSLAFSLAYVRLIRPYHAKAGKPSLVDQSSSLPPQVRSLGIRGFIQSSLGSLSGQSEALRVLYVIEPSPFTYVSGYANRFQETLRSFKRLTNDSIVIFTPEKENMNGNCTKSNNFVGYPISTVRGFELYWYKQVTLTLDIKGHIGKLLRQFTPHLVHATMPSVVAYAAVMWSKLFYRIPLVLSYHTDLIKYAQSYASFPGSSWLATWLVKLPLLCADLVLCTSPQLQRQLHSIGIATAKVWRKGVNAQIFSPLHYNASLRLDMLGKRDGPLLLYVGRLGKEKKLERLRHVLDRLPQATLIVVGDGPHQASLQSHFVGRNAKFVGSMTGLPLSQMYASCDVFVMPSDTETLGFVAMEAMASGIPVVGVNAGGLPDVIDHNSTGYLSSLEHVDEELPLLVERLVNDKDLRKQFGKAGRVKALQWSWDQATLHLRDEYCRLVRETGAQ